MSERLDPPHDPQDDSERLLFESLEQDMTDPHITTVHALAREYEAHFRRAHEPTEAERGYMVHELDTAWGNYMRKPLAISGKLKYLSGDTSVTVGVENETVLSNGFSFEPEPIMHDGEEIGRRWQVGHSVATTYGQPEGRQTMGFVALETLTSLILPFPSEQYRIKRFEENSSDEAAIIRSAAKQGIEHAIRTVAPLSHTIDTDNPVRQQDTIDWLMYVRRYVMPEIDSMMPQYIATVQGPMQRIIGNFSIPTEYPSPEAMLVSLSQVGIGPTELRKNDLGEVSNIQELRVQVEATRLHEDMATPAEHLLIPASSIIALMSLRRVAHQQMRKSQ